MTDKNIEKMRDMLREIKRHAGLIINNIVFTACEATNIQTLASEALALLAEETPPKEPTINEPIKVGIGLLVPACQSKEEEFTKRLKWQTDEMLKKLPEINTAYWSDKEKQYFKEFITTLSKWLYEACTLIDRLAAENNGYKKALLDTTKIHIQISEFNQLQADIATANEKIEKRDKAVRYNSVYWNNRRDETIDRECKCNELDIGCCARCYIIGSIAENNLRNQEILGSDFEQIVGKE